jgi:hypothetical protein
VIIINFCANFDILYYLSNSITRYAAQTAFEINTMLYLSQLLSLYDGNTTSKWGYLFTRNKFGAPISIEILKELERFSTSGVLEQESNGYYRLSDSFSKNIIDKLAKSHVFEWRTKYIRTSIDSILTKPFPKVIDAIQYEPGIRMLEEINRTSILHGNISADLLFKDFKVIREIIDNPNIDLLIPASLWIDYLEIQATQGVKRG